MSHLLEAKQSFWAHAKEALIFLVAKSFSNALIGEHPILPWTMRGAPPGQKMNCNECLENLVAYLEGLLSPEQGARLQAHLETCEACRVERDEFAHLRRRLVSRGHARGPSQAATEI